MLGARIGVGPPRYFTALRHFAVNVLTMGRCEVALGRLIMYIIKKPELLEISLKFSLLS